MRDPSKELRIAIETAERRLITSRVVVRAKTAADALAIHTEHWSAISAFLDSRNVELMTLPVDRIDEKLRTKAWAAFQAALLT